MTSPSVKLCQAMTTPEPEPNSKSIKKLLKPRLRMFTWWFSARNLTSLLAMIIAVINIKCMHKLNGKENTHRWQMTAFTWTGLHLERRQESDVHHKAFINAGFCFFFLCKLFLKACINEALPCYWIIHKSFLHSNTISPPSFLSLFLCLSSVPRAVIHEQTCRNQTAAK